MPNAGAETQTSPLTWSDPYWIIGNTCYTVFNEDMSWSVGGGGDTLDIQTIALHEFGHWLRLEDLSDLDDATKVMYYKTYPGTTKRSLHAGDIAGIIAIYGN